MINFLEGILAEKSLQQAVINVNGIGYEIFINASTSERLCDIGQRAKLFVVEAMAMYGGTTTLYGFLTKAEKETFYYFKDYVPNTGAKKALEYVDKAGKSFADFKQAIKTGDSELLTTIFGFTKKTAGKLISSLQDKISDFAVEGKQKWKRDTQDNIYTQAKASLIALGYRDGEIDRIFGSFSEEEIKGLRIEEFLKKVLQKVKI
ncbi:MAG: Holliday junction branch migration protein RuvA [bacterium]